ncbi:transmembrane protein 192 [Myripristis murdjan]|uniref:Transmembrane protein 192 n=1 Tax=Myripristis murdjan TaxID=586833 RepID=A0A667YNV6_9TELE|nr:transmembrane protein 192 [Myripristis murdjan]
MTDPKGASLYAASTSADVTRSTEEDPLVDGPLISADALHSAIRREFQTIPTPCPAALLSLLHMVYVALSICVAVECELELGRAEECGSVLGVVKGQSVIVFGKVCLWVLVLFFGECVQHHHSRARSRGYLRFYRQTQGLQRLPLTVHSAGNVLLLVVLAARLKPLLSISMILGILGLELVVALLCLLLYTVRVMQFNRDRAMPDVSQEEISHTYSNTSLPTETGFREGSSLEEVVEKQADLIEYLKQHNTLLSKRLLNLTAQH